VGHEIIMNLGCAPHIPKIPYCEKETKELALMERERKGRKISVRGWQGIKRGFILSSGARQRVNLYITAPTQNILLT